MSKCLGSWQCHAGRMSGKVMVMRMLPAVKHVKVHGAAASCYWLPSAAQMEVLPQKCSVKRLLGTRKWAGASLFAGSISKP